MNIVSQERTAMSVRIAFRGPVIAENADAAGSGQEQTFGDLPSMTDWVMVHVPSTERRLIRLWINDTPITGATLEATLRPLPPNGDDWLEVV